MVQGQSIKCFFMLLHQILGLLRDELLNLFVLGAKRGGKRRFVSNQVLLLGVEQDAVLRLIRLVLAGLRLRHLLCFVKISLL